MSNSPHKIGVIGLGAIGHVTLASMNQHEDYEVVCAWDPDGAACARVSEAHPDVQITASADEVIGHPDTTAVYIASPPTTHVAYARSTAEAGKCIFCEKPLGIDIAESEALVELAAQRNLPAAINFNHTNARGSTHLENEIRSGAAGNVTGVDIFIHLEKWPRDFQAHATWLAGREQGGFTREMISHWVYLTRRLLGDGKIVTRNAAFPGDPTKSETRLVAELEFGGVPTVINAACGGAGPVGTQYTLWADKKSFMLQSGGRISETDGSEWKLLFEGDDEDGEDDITRNIGALAKAFRREPVTVATLEDGLAVQRIVEALITE
ncbi:MAG: Gfo/Idh/MocA family oxidoreductase [Hyphomicrobiaceae bacterium]|nr:Gfo/Idh/MocA family oxidoreductase [Hyphomicrobiaceae bacterium]